ncbi:condensin subunit Cnd3 [Coprinopsis cinerea okayama7|uniref:Condensin subunit Cnd3 n=1 Tax=Coprinopsis cinerea (strain Okayama-7 / 130 / ATCC MYA-4618 / FGSC 9003) TaxID=240176 RepID=A8NCK0_COPC7|nr:condensin subunit Cnd3 [Coprinopsis cinerea okayama7\|eukprot:XP_001832544.2 condensin subunit Cnd3 [Coprinopsis cinerea okayama7\
MAKSAEPYDLEELPEAIATIFDQVQLSLANHKKNCVALYKLHLRAATVTKTVQKKNGTTSTKYVGEKAFADTFLDMVNRVLVIKKGPPAADRIVKFVGSYVEYLNEKVMQEQAKGESEEADDTTTSRFIARILGWLLEGFSAKNKIVRFRCLHVVSELISHIGEIDEDTYSLLREGLIERLSDKETIIRANAAAALSKLVGSEDPDEIETGEQSVLDILLDVLASDPTAEVRRAALLNVPLTSATIDAVLLRTRDVDTITRKIMYTAVLPKLGHPRQLTLVQREQVIKDGLGDREPGVRVAAGKLLAKWFDIVQAESSAEEEQDPEAWVGDDGGLMKAFIKFMGLFDVIGSGEAIAVDAVTCIFVTRPDIPDAFVFPDLYWRQLTPESAVIARVFVEHCIKTNNETRLESASLPVVTAFAFHIQEAYNRLLSALEQLDAARLVQTSVDDDHEELEEELAKREVVLGELLRMALKLDYMDEIGRRKVFTVVKDMLAHPQLPPGLIERCVDVLKEIMPSERDLIRVVVEIIVELRESEDIEETENLLESLDDDPDQSVATENASAVNRSVRRPRDREAMSAEARREADITDIRCLMLCIAVLERSFEDNSTLEGILADLIIPSVKRKELAMREKALVSLGLCCLLAKLFLGQVENAPPELKLQVLRVILDLLIMYDTEFFKNSGDIAQQVTTFLVQTLQTEELPQAQAVLCTGICKLLLAGIITDTTVLESLALLYISPTTVDNQELRQCLSYFFPAYSYATYANQLRMQSMFLSAYDHAKRLHEELDDDQDMISPADFGLMFVDWSDPTKAVHIADAELSESENAHIDLGIQVLSALYDEERTDDDKKAFCQVLTHLVLPATIETKAVHKLDLLISNQEDHCPFENPSLDKLFARFKKSFYGTFQERIKEIDAREYAEDEDVVKVYKEIGVKPPVVDEEFRAGREERSVARLLAREEGLKAGEKEEGEKEREREREKREEKEEREEEQEDEVVSAAPSTTAAPSEQEDEEREVEEEVEAEAEEAEMNGPSRVESEKEESMEPEPQPEPEAEVEVERPSTPPPSKGTKRVHNTPGTTRDDRKRTRTTRGAATRKVKEEKEEEEVEPARDPSPTPKATRTRGARAKAASAATAAATASKKAPATKATTRTSRASAQKASTQKTSTASTQKTSTASGQKTKAATTTRTSGRTSGRRKVVVKEPTPVESDEEKENNVDSEMEGVESGEE